MGPSNLQAIITNIKSFAEGLEQEKVVILLRPAVSKKAGEHASADISTLFKAHSGRGGTPGVTFHLSYFC